MAKKDFKSKNEKMREAHKLLSSIPTVDGEKRCIYECQECGRLWGSRYIPYGFGRGAAFNKCICCCVNINAVQQSKVILEATP